MTDIAILSTHLQNRLQAALTPGERLVWVGQPIPGHYRKRRVYEYRVLFAVLALFGLLWMAGSIARTLLTSGPGVDLLALAGLPLLLLGVVGLRGSSTMADEARHMVYAITSERVLLLGGDDPEIVSSYGPAQLQEIERTEYDGGWGDLILQTKHVPIGDHGYTTRRYGLLAIAGVRRAHELVAALAKTLPLAPGTPHPSYQKALMTPEIAALPDRLSTALQAELGPGERLVWAAQPIPASYLKKGLRKWRYFIPGTLSTLLFCVLMAPALWNPAVRGWGVLQVAGTPLLLLGIAVYCLLQPLRMRKHAAGVVHAITTERALSIDTRGPVLTRTYAPAALVHVRCAGGPDDSGDLLLEPAFDNNTPIASQLHRHGFMGIGDVRHVERLIGHLKQAPAA
ncbi:hypothetical protein [Massilia aquatica]|uniref:PH domain-containing protein n=1 Tax=Massilia aquatica TaxID=2609000 RepID=A0ABX0MJ54_9BURK|nr:hypothetical protein [Massilia aquatica]NHZ44992.1 hypothetical protein [Massilia aquatica]